MRAAMIVAAVLMALSTTATSAASAQTHGPQLQVSRHGHHWHRTLHRPLFGSRLRPVPGDSFVRHFYVRTSGMSESRLTVLGSNRSMNRLVARGEARFAVRRQGYPWRRMRAQAIGQRLSVTELATARPTRIDVRVRFPFRDRNRTQHRTIHFGFVVAASGSRLTIVEPRPHYSAVGTDANDGAAQAGLPGGSVAWLVAGIGALWGALALRGIARGARPRIWRRS
jgi:hypothetical protein